MEITGENLRYHLEENLGLKTCIADALLFFKKLREKLIGLCGIYVDDTLHAGIEEYSKLRIKTEETFNSKTR